MPGVAAKTQEFLESKGYKVLEIGNAEEVGRADTLLKFKASKTGYKDLVINDLKDEYDIVTDETLDESAAYGLLMVVGLN